MSVDLPAPFSPIRVWTSPRRSEKSTPSSATTPGNRMVMPSISTMGLAIVSVNIVVLLRQIRRGPDPFRPPADRFLVAEAWRDSVLAVRQRFLRLLLVEALVGDDRRLLDRL